MPDSAHPIPVPENYRRVTGSERHPTPEARYAREANATDSLILVIRVTASDGQAGLDRLAAFAGERGLVVVGVNVIQQSIVVWGAAARVGEAFAVPLGVYESPAGSYCGWDGHLHLPTGLAEAVEAVTSSAEREIESFESWLGGILGQGQTGPEKPEYGQGTGTAKGDRPVKVFDLIVPESGPKGRVDPAAFSLVQTFDLGWLLDPGYQRQLDNFVASPGAFKTVRVMKVFTNSIATVTTSRPAGPNENGASAPPRAATYGRPPALSTSRVH